MDRTKALLILCIGVPIAVAFLCYILVGLVWTLICGIITSFNLRRKWSTWRSEIRKVWGNKGTIWRNRSDVKRVYSHHRRRLRRGVLSSAWFGCLQVTHTNTYHEFICEDAAKNLLQEDVEAVMRATKLNDSVAKILLQVFRWDVATVLRRFTQDPRELFVEARLCSNVEQIQELAATSSSECEICLLPDSALVSTEEIHGEGLSCGHAFCKDCWKTHFVTQIQDGNSTTISCMAEGCQLLVGETFVLTMIQDTEQTERYLTNTFYSHVERHEKLRVCGGCGMIAHRLLPSTPHHVYCSNCGTRFCFDCTLDHPGFTCTKYAEHIVKWRKADDPKPCPKCKTSIQKNGGCEYVFCTACRYEFCFKCLKSVKECDASSCKGATVHLNQLRRTDIVILPACLCFLMSFWAVVSCILLLAYIPTAIAYLSE